MHKQQKQHLLFVRLSESKNFFFKIQYICIEIDLFTALI